MTRQQTLSQFSRPVNVHIETFLLTKARSMFLTQNSQRKTGIYLKLNLGLKAFLVINGLTSWVLSDRGDVVFRNHSTLWTVRRDLLSLLSEFQLMSNISISLFPNWDAGAHQRAHSPLQRGAGEVCPWRMRCGLQTWSPPVWRALLSSLISHSM